MKLLSTFYLVIVSFVLLRNGCFAQTTEYLTELDSVITFEDQEKYLNYLFYEDQRIRKGKEKDSILQSFGPEYGRYVQEYEMVDSMNVERALAFVHKFGYPDEKDFNEYAGGVISLIFHHSGDLSLRKRVYPILYEAYKKGKYNEVGFLWFLNRAHGMKFGQMYYPEEWKGDEAHIYELIDRLEWGLPKKITTPK